MKNIVNFPHRLQGFDYDCGPTAVMTVLHYYGHRVNEQTVIDALGTDIDGTTNEGIEAGLTKLGVDFKRVSSLAELDESLNNGYPVVVCSQTDPKDWHYSVAVARRGDEYIMADPWEIGLASVPVKVFDLIWLEEDGTRWGVSVIGESTYTEGVHPLEVRLAKIMASRNPHGLRGIANDLTSIAADIMQSGKTV